MRDYPASALKYIHILYWAFNLSAAAGDDLKLCSNFERVFQIFLMLYFRVLIAFIAAEITNIFQSYKSIFSEHIERVSLLSMYDKDSR